MPGLGLRLTPHGRLIAEDHDDAPALDPAAHTRLAEAFAQGSGEGLVRLGAGEVGQALPPVLVWWRGFATRYVGGVCLNASGREDDNALPPVPPPDGGELAALALTAPVMEGAEYLTDAVLRTLWDEMAVAFAQAFARSGAGLQGFLNALNPAWNLVGRVHFNLAENRRDAAQPFAFMATDTTRLSAQARAQRVPLGRALREYAGANRDQLLSLLLPVQRASEHCGWLRAMVEAGEIYHPLRWTPAQALQFLSDGPQLEAAGIVIRAPSTWRAGRPSRPQVKASVGGKVPSVLGKDALLDFDMQITLDGERLSAAEIKKLLAGADGLQWLRGRWVEVDRGKLGRMLEHFREVEKAAAGGLPFAEAMRLVAGANALEADEADVADTEWSQVVAGPWLAATLQNLRSPEGLAHVELGAEIKATLRPYQHAGVRWLYLLHRLGLGACLADDMGLGKTIQVLSLLSVLKNESSNSADGTQQRSTSVLVAPASLLANWAAEIERFAPNLRTLIAHTS